jgi:hypothetical protein
LSITHSTRTGKTYYLHAGVTKTGKPKYYFSTKKDGALVDTIPEGFEVYENIDGQVFLRTITKQIIQPEELVLVQAALLRHGEEWQYKAEIKKDTITVHECGSDIAGIDEMATRFTFRPLSSAEKARFAHYTAVLRFVLADKQQRTFATERFCFRGSVDRWIYIAGPADLSVQLKKYIKHLGRESMYELF